MSSLALEDQHDQRRAILIAFLFVVKIIVFDRHDRDVCVDESQEDSFQRLATLHSRHAIDRFDEKHGIGAE